jgi:hypothetical protein
MSPEQTFTIANSVALVTWLLLAILPRRQWVTHIVTAVAVPGVFAGLYIMIVATQFGRSAGGFGSLAEVALLFDNPWMLVAVWWAPGKREMLVNRASRTRFWCRAWA